MPSIDLAKRRAPDVGVDGTRAAMVERVERLKPKLQGRTFTEVDVLYQRDVPQLEARPENGARLFGPEVPGCGNESSSIEELRCRLRSVGISDYVSAELSSGAARHV